MNDRLDQRKEKGKHVICEMKETLDKGRMYSYLHAFKSVRAIKELQLIQICLLTRKSSFKPVFIYVLW